MRETIVEIIMQIRAAWRFRWYAMVLAWVIAMFGWVFVMVMPNTYEASARVFVDTDSMLRPLLKGLAVQTDVGQRLRLMTRTLLSRPNIEKVARETDLDIKAASAEEKEALLQKLTEDIQLQSTRKQNLYSITYQNSSPKLSKDVVQALLTIFVETTLGDTRQDSDTAQKFLNEQIAEYEARLVEAENRLTEFKRKHVGALPGQGGGVFQRLETTKTLYDQAQLELNEATNKRDELKRQLEDAEAKAAVGEIGETSLDSRILDMQKNLDQLLLRFTEEHPDVKELRATIAALGKQKIKEESEQEAPVVQSTLIDELKLSLGQAEAERAAVKVRESEYKRRLDKLNKLVNTLPEVETELNRLSRDYAVNKSNYDLLLNRRESARMAESADAAGDSVKFKVIDPPRLPVLPVKPYRLVLFSAVLVLSLAAGGVVAFLLSQINPVVMDVNSLRKLSGYPVFGSVSRIWTPALMFKRKLEVTAFFVVLACLVVLFGAVLVVNGYAGDIAWLKDLRGGI